MTQINNFRSYLSTRGSLFLNDMKQNVNFIISFASSPVHYYLHEQGHVFTINLMYDNANPIIKMTGFGGGETRYNTDSRLSPLGKTFGKDAESVILAGGPLINIISYVALMALSGSNKNIADILSLHTFVLAVNAVSAYPMQIYEKSTMMEYCLFIAATYAIRKFAIYGFSNHNRKTKNIIASLTSHLFHAALLPLVAASNTNDYYRILKISGWIPYTILTGATCATACWTDHIYKSNPTPQTQNKIKLLR